MELFSYLQMLFLILALGVVGLVSLKVPNVRKAVKVGLVLFGVDPNVEFSVAAATAVLEYNLMTSNPSVDRARRTPYRRVLRGLALKGSAAAGDTAVDLFVDGVFSGRFYNTGTGFPNMDDVKPTSIIVPPSAEVSLIVVDAPVTSPINGILSFAE